MKITKEQLDRLIRVAVLDILKELEAKAQQAGLGGEAEPSPDEPPVHMGEAAKPKPRPTPKPAPKPTPKTTKK